MTQRAPSRVSFSVDDLTEVFLGAISHMLAVAGPTTGGGQPLRPRSIHSRIALKAAARSEIEAGTNRFHLAQAGERIDATAALQWWIEAPGSLHVTLVDISKSAQSPAPIHEQSQEI